MAGDGTWLTVGEAAERLGGVHPETIRRYARDGLLYAKRLPKGHRRVWAESIGELEAVESMPPGPEKDAAVAELRARNLRRNRGEAEPTGGG